MARRYGPFTTIAAFPVEAWIERYQACDPALLWPGLPTTVPAIYNCGFYVRRNEDQTLSFRVRCDALQRGHRRSPTQGMTVLDLATVRKFAQQYGYELVLGR
jgi:hypothetical protein